MSVCRAASSVEIEKILRTIIHPITEQIQTASAIAHLKERGYNVAAPYSKPERAGDFMRRVGITNWESLHRDIALWQDGGSTLVVRYYPGGRIREIESNSAFDKFVVRFKT